MTAMTNLFVQFTDGVTDDIVIDFALVLFLTDAYRILVGPARLVTPSSDTPRLSLETQKPQSYML